ncbi:MAG: serine/threonine-protein kinase [Polyangia bacterium]
MVAQVPARKYRIERYLAEGGMGAIYVGKKIGAGGFEKEVVLKQLLPEFTSRPEFRDLFFREAKISATLDHQNIVRTFDLVTSDDRLFIVMEYVRGADLRSISWRARRKRPLSAQAILHVALEILAGLAYAHRRRSPSGEPLGIIHRDLSPSNILCSAEGEVKLSDFGIAKAATYSSAFYRVRGKVGYMSPEMAHNQPIDSRSDLFSLGVSTYETLIGERVYAGDLNTPAEQIYAQSVPSLATKCPSLPPELQGVFDKALALDRDERFQDAESFSDAVREVAHRHSLLYSAPQLAAELRDLLGPNPDLWLRDDGDPQRAQTDRPAHGASDLEGQEASAVAVGSGADGEVPTLVELARSRKARPLAAGGDQAGDPQAAALPPAIPAPAGAEWPVAGSAAVAVNKAGLPGPATPPLAPAAKPINPPWLVASFTSPPRGGVAAVRRSRRNLWIVLALTTLALLAAGALLFRGGATRPTAPTTKGMIPGAVVPHP